MNAPDSLPQRMFLLALLPEKGRLPFGAHVGEVVRAAALADLYLAGQIVDRKGRPGVDVRTRSQDPILDGVLEEIANGRPRKWQYWVSRRGRQTLGAVRAQLVDGGYLREDKSRFLGVFTATRYTLRDPRVRTRLLGVVSSALSSPVGRVDPADAALVALAVNGGLDAVVDRRKRRERKQRIDQLAAVTGPAAPALKRAIAAANAAAAG